jgi:hypothetical protein
VQEACAVKYRAVKYRRIVCVALAVCSLPAAAAEDLRIHQLMQDINELKQMVREQAQRIDRLESQFASRSPAAALPVPNPSSAGAAGMVPESRRWLAPANWDRLRPGMSEQEVLTILGYPTSVRSAPDSSDKTLFYTVQLGPSGFLSGHVVLADHKVREVEKPTLQ